MKKKEFKVGEEFQLGLKRLTVKQGGEDCLGCWFAENNVTNCIKMVGACNSRAREDKKNVIFKEIEN